jgi:hypothetical protein
MVGKRTVVKRKPIVHKLPFELHNYFSSSKHGGSHNYYGTIVLTEPTSPKITQFDCCRVNELVKIRYVIHMGTPL